MKGMDMKVIVVKRVVDVGTCDLACDLCSLYEGTCGQMCELCGRYVSAIYIHGTVAVCSGCLEATNE